MDEILVDCEKVEREEIEMVRGMERWKAARSATPACLMDLRLRYSRERDIMEEDGKMDNIAVRRVDMDRGWGIRSDDLEVWYLTQSSSSSWRTGI